MSNQILIIDDDKNLVDLITDRLESENYKVAVALTGSEGLAQVKTVKPDLILLDWRLPDKDGLEICRLLKSGAGVCPPIIMLSGLARESDRVSSLEGGADDYLTKPFSMNELVARIRVQLRKQSAHTDRSAAKILDAGGIILNEEQRTVTVEGTSVDLPPKAFQILKVLMEHQEKVLDRNFLTQKIWGHEHMETMRIIDVHIASLRKKLGARGKCIVTVERIGYKFSPDR